MLTEFFAAMTEWVRGGWLGLAAAPWRSLFLSLLVLAALPAMGYGAAWVMARRQRQSPTAPVADDAALQRLTRERDEARREAARTRAALETTGGAADSQGLQSQLMAAQDAADAAMARATDAEQAAAAAEVRMRDAEDALLRTSEERDAAQRTLESGQRDDEASRQMLASARTEAEAARMVAEQKACDAESRAARAEAAAEAARQAEAVARAALEQQRVRADAAESARQAAEAEAARIEAAAATAQAAALGADVIAAAHAVDAGEMTVSAALPPAQKHAALVAPAIAVGARLRAIDALKAGREGLIEARRLLAAAAAVGLPDDAGMADDIDVLTKTVEAAIARGDELGAGAEGASNAGLPRLAEILWLHEADQAEEDADRGAALAQAAEAALWGGRWAQAAQIASTALPLLEGASAETRLSARLTQAQARLFAGGENGPALAAALAVDAAAELGGASPITVAARRLAARAAFEQGDAKKGEDLAALLSEGGVDPITDPAIRAARARGLMAKGDTAAAHKVFEALARQAKEGSRSALGHRLDALEALLADGGEPMSVSDALDALAPRVLEAFGPRHMRAGQAALLKAGALAEAGELIAAAAMLDEADGLLSLRLDPAHRWRRAATALRIQIDEAMIEETALRPDPDADDWDAMPPLDDPAPGEARETAADADSGEPTPAVPPGAWGIPGLRP